MNTSATDSFSHANESANAGDYKVALGNGVTTELTATTRTGMADFTFPSTPQANLIFTLGGSQNGDSATSFTVVSGTEVQGAVTSGGFCGAGNTYTEHFDMKFSQPFATNGTFTAAGLQKGARQLTVKQAKAAVTPKTVSPGTPERPNHPVYHGVLPKKDAAAALYACNGTGAKQWRATTSGQLINPESGRCLDDPNSSTASGTKLDIWTCNGAANQHWTLPAS